MGHRSSPVSLSWETTDPPFLWSPFPLTQIDKPERKFTLGLFTEENEEPVLG